VIADIFFLHDRGKWNTLYWVTFTGGVMVVPIISGSMTTHLGWRSFWWLNTALVALSTLLAIFLFPETKWHRPHPDEVPHTPTISLELKPKAESIEDPTGDKAANTNAITAGPNDLTPIESPRDPWLGRGKPSKAQWGLYTPNATPLKSILIDVWIPIKLFAFPIVQFASFVVSWSCSSFLVLNMTQSQAFAAPPYNWSSQTVGFTNFAITAGGLIGLFTAGPLSDWVSARATAKNGGIREPEMRLPAMIPYVLIMFLGNIVVSVGYEKAWPWEAIVIIGYTCAGIQSAAIPSIASTYAVDSYKPVASSLFMSVTVYKNLWGYGMGKFLTDWIVKDGYIEPIMINAALIFLWCLFGFLFYFKGKTFRRWSKNSSVHRM
jgi:hypothetical protein